MLPKITQKPFGLGRVSYSALYGSLKFFLIQFATELLEEHMHQVSPSRMEELIRIFIRATELEIRFWDMGLSDQKM